MSVIGAIGTALFGTLTFLNAIAGEAWTRYFILLAGLFVNNTVGSFSGFFPVESVLSFVISTVFNVQGFAFPVYYGISSLLILFATMPLIFFIAKTSVSLARPR